MARVARGLGATSQRSVPCRPSGSGASGSPTGPSRPCAASTSTWPPGEVFGFLGPNGAGKTTIVEILEGYRQRSAGDVEVLGHDPAKGERALRERIGIVLQETGVERFLKVAEVLELYCGYYPRPRAVDELLALTGLEAKRNEVVKELSGGQRRRLDLALGLAGDPELVFLDEPTTGFDPTPAGRRGRSSATSGRSARPSS